MFPLPLQEGSVLCLSHPPSPRRSTQRLREVGVNLKKDIAMVVKFHRYSGKMPVAMVSAACRASPPVAG